MAKTNTQSEENPRKTVDQQHQPTDLPTIRNEYSPSNATLQQLSTPALDAPVKDGGVSKLVGDSLETGDPVGSTATNDNGHNAPFSNIQKKIRRAERFGMPVQLSEEEKRNSRAERFGTGSAVHESDAVKKSEEQKRKARAERFGLAPSASTDEVAKKKARLARFAAVSKTDSLEEDKKKARAIRFSVPQSSSPSLVNGKGNIEPPKAAIAGKAGGGA